MLLWRAGHVLSSEALSRDNMLSRPAQYVECITIMYVGTKFLPRCPHAWASSRASAQTAVILQQAARLMEMAAVFFSLPPGTTLLPLAALGGSEVAFA